MKDVIKIILNVITKKEVYGVVLILAISYFIYQTIVIILEDVINKGKSKYEQKKRLTITKLFKNISKYIIVVTAGLALLSLYGINIKGMLAGVGIAGTIIGLALQDTFKDFIGGISIILENYFIVGDIVKYGTFTGEVIEFGFKSTKIKNVNGEILMLANRNIYEIINLSQSSQLVQLNLSAAYEETVENVEKVINNYILPKIEKINNVTPKSATYLGISALDSSDVKYLIQFKCGRETQWQTKRDALRVIKNECDKHNIKIPYQQLEVHNGE